MPLFDVTKPAPEPVQVDFVRVMVVGTLVWAAALVVTIVLALAGATGGVPVAVCAAGAALGLLGIDWARRHRPAPTPPAAPPAAPPA